MSGPAPAPLDPAVQEILRNSPIGPLLNKPIDQVLASIGLPGLPPIPALPPMPGLPPMPALDPVVLLKPITDMMGQFGSGQLGGLGGLNPAEILSQIASGLTQVISLGASAIGLLAGLQGAGTEAAAAKGAQAQSNAVEVTNQAGAIKSIVTGAAMAVQVGNAELAAIAAKLAATTAALAAVPGGQPAIVAAAAEAAAESAAVVAQVRAELTAFTAQLSTAGAPIPITKPPNSTKHAPAKAAPKLAKAVLPAAKSAPSAAPSVAQSSGQGIQQLQQLVTPVTQLLQQGTQTVTQVTHRPKVTGSLSAIAGQGFGPTPALAGGAAVAAGAAGGMVKPVALRAFGAGMPLGGATSSAMTSTAGPWSTEEAVAARATTPLMPIAGPTGQRAGDAGTSAVHSYLVTEQHGDEVVGDIEGVATPVFGAAERLVEPPDQALTL